MADNDATKSIEVPTQKPEAEVARKQAEATGGHEARLKAVQLTAEETRQQALKDDEAKGMIHGIPKDEFKKMSFGAQKRAELNNPYSDLRNRLSPQDEVDFQILSNTNAYTIEAMTGVSIAKLTDRAKELGVPLKDSAAGNGQPGAIHG